LIAVVSCPVFTLWLCAGAGAVDSSNLRSICVGFDCRGHGRLDRGDQPHHHQDVVTIVMMMTTTMLLLLLIMMLMLLLLLL
jgi:hypothetical protein